MGSIYQLVLMKIVHVQIAVIMMRLLKMRQNTVEKIEGTIKCYGLCCKRGTSRRSSIDHIKLFSFYIIRGNSNNVSDAV